MILLLLAPQAHAYEFIDLCNGQPTRWDPMITEWWLHVPAGGTAHSTLTDAEVLAANQAGWEVWSDTTTCCTGFQSVYGGTTTTPYNTQDDLNVVAFEETNWDEAAFGSVNVTIAITVPSYYTSDCLIENADQLYNGVGFDFSVVSNPSPQQTDVQSIMAHENGHWLGLTHSSVGTATMYFSYAGGTGGRTLHTDDEAGVCASHPGNCGPQEQCDNGTDDDADGLVDCEDPGCAGHPVCTCPINGRLGCDATLATTNSVGASTVDTYSCSQYPLTGPEAVYSFTPNEDGQVTVRVTGLTADVDLVITDGSSGSCEPDATCWSSSNGGTTDESVTFDAFGGVTYTAVVDGYDGAVADFEISTTCPAPTGGGECLAQQEPLRCDEVVEGSNYGFTNDVQNWNCVDWMTTGPEAIYEFTPTADQQVTLSLTGLAADLDLFVSDKVGEGCSEDACVASSGRADLDDEELTFEALAGVTYMVVVDGFSGNTSDFDLAVSCDESGLEPEPEPTDSGDLDTIGFEECGCSTGSPWSVSWAVLGLGALFARRRPAS